jgi:hypothetical protein
MPFQPASAGSERDLQPVGLFGIDVQAQVVAPGQYGQAEQARIELAHHEAELGAAVARVQRGELDRNAWPLVHAASGRCDADGVDRRLVGPQVALRIGLRQRGFAEHVVGVAKAFALPLARMDQGFVDGLPGDELLAHHAHRQVHALADQRLAPFADQAGQRAAEAPLGVCGHQLAGDDQAPGRGVDEHRAAVPEVRAPVGLADLVADQRVARRRVGNAQQGLGQAHQRHAFL